MPVLLKNEGISEIKERFIQRYERFEESLRNTEHDKGLGGQTGIPVTIIKGPAVVGFDRARLDSLL
jgi:hypothetical protein